jgi:hypothetical protein
MIAKLGTTAKIALFARAEDRGQPGNYTERMVNIISEGPPGVQGVWAVTISHPRVYLLVRKDKSGLYAVQGDKGEAGGQ